MLCYQIRQPFPPGELDPEEALNIGYEMAMRCTKGKHAFFVVSHADRPHPHVHIYYNSTTLDCTRKLNNYYPHLTECVTLEVSEEIAVTLSIGGRMCDSYKRRKRDHDECSLDGTPGFEADVTYLPLNPEETMELAEDRAALYAALGRLPPVQARRVYARFILGRAVSQIAEAEDMEERNVRETINKGLRRLKKIWIFLVEVHPKTRKNRLTGEEGQASPLTTQRETCTHRPPVLYYFLIKSFKLGGGYGKINLGDENGWQISI